MIAGDAAAAGQPGNPVTIRAQFLQDWQEGGGVTNDASPSGAAFSVELLLPPARTAGHWRQSDVKRAITAAEQAGLQHYRVEIAPDGTLAIVVGGSVAEGSEVITTRG